MPLYRIIVIAVIIALIITGVGLYLSNEYSLLGYKNLGVNNTQTRARTADLRLIRPML